MSLSNIKICIQKIVSKQVDQPHVAGIVAAAVFDDEFQWPIGSTITVSFLPLIYGTPKWERSLETIQEQVTAAQFDIERRVRMPNMSPPDVVKMVVTELVQPVVPTINFKFIESGTGDVRVRFTGDGPSYSQVGIGSKLSTDEFSMTFGWLDVATIIHEFTHVLGMLHEHQSPAGGIQWNRPKVYEWAAVTQGWDKRTTDENILNTAPANEVSNSPFDPDSIMLYFFDEELTLNGVGTKENFRYSATDIEWLGDKYKVPRETTRAAISNLVLSSGGEPLAGGNSDPSTTSQGILIAIIVTVLIAIGLFLFFTLK